MYVILEHDSGLNLECNEEIVHRICITQREAAACMNLLTMYNQYFSSCVFLRKNLSYDQRVFFKKNVLNVLNVFTNTLCICGFTLRCFKHLESFTLFK